MKIVRFSKSEYRQLTPTQKKDACGWDDVTAMYDREILVNHPFVQTTYSEDAIWAYNILGEGYSIIYNAAARVYHYHHEDADYVFKRSLTVMYFRYRYFGFLHQASRLSLRSYLSMMKILLKEKKIPLKQKWYWLKYNRMHDQSAERARKAFMTALAQSEDALDKLHEKYCGRAPMPLKPTTERFAYVAS